MGRRRKDALPKVRVTDHGGRKYARIRVGGITHHLGRVHGELTPVQAAKADALSCGQLHWAVYLIGDCNGNVKVGIAQDADERLRQLQIGNASTLVLIYQRHFASEFDARRCESHCHEKLHLFAVRGEWFRCSAWEARDVVNGFARKQEEVA